MKRARVCLLLLPLLFAGCASDTDPEDRAFYNRGWLNPRRDIDGDPGMAPRRDEPGMPPPKMPKDFKPDPLDY